MAYFCLIINNKAFQDIKTKRKYLSVVQEALSFSLLHLRFLNILELLLHWFFAFFFFNLTTENSKAVSSC